jgi:hypothetical protein
MAEESKPKKGYAAPLEGIASKEIMTVLNLAFLLISFRMLQGLALTGTGAKMAASGSKFSSPRPPGETLH